MERKSILREKSFAFAVRIVKLVQYMQSDKKEFVLSKQLLRSGTAVGALISEAQYGQSDADFLSKMNIALKEVNETVYWIKLLYAVDYLTEKEFTAINNDSEELLAMLVSTTKTMKTKIKAKNKKSTSNYSLLTSN